MKNKFTPDEFRSWVEWTRQRLPAEGDIPAILGDEWNNIRENQSPPWFDSIWSHYEDFDSRHDPDILNFIANESVLNPDDLACRFTALRYLYELSQFDYANCSLIRADAEFASTQKGFLGDLVIMVGLVKEEEVRDWRRIRWEILTAYVICDWSRALTLYNQAERLELIGLAELQGLRGQFRFLQAFAKEGLDLSTLMWEPRLYSAETDPAFGVILLCWGCCHRNDYPSVDTLDLGVVQRASHDLEAAVSKKIDLPLLYRSLLAGCQFALSEFQKAAANYVLLKSRIHECEAIVFKGAWQSAALSYSRGGETQRAITAYQRLLERFPNEKGIYLRIAELHTRTIPPDPGACCEALRKEMERNPAADDWQLSTILMLGETASQSEASEETIKKLYRSNPEFQLSERLTKSLLKVYWPSFDCLNEIAKEEWVFGETLVQSTLAEPSQASLRTAVRNFATAVEIELRSRIFERFRDFRDAYSVKSSQPERSDRQPLIKPNTYLEGKGNLTLGDMSTILEHCKRPQGKTLIEFEGWLRNAKFDLNTNPMRLSQVKDLRNRATHPSTEAKIFSREHLANMQKWCREILEALPKLSTN